MSSFRQNIKTIIFGTDTRAGKLFDEILILAIILSIITVLLESVTEYNQQYGQILNSAEWFFTIIFTMEYFLRMYIMLSIIAKIKISSNNFPALVSVPKII